MPFRPFDAPFNTRLTRYVYAPMRDGVRLACDIYRPAADGAFPFLLVRTPYDKNGFNRDEADYYVRRGYGLCVADGRGTGGSEGDFTYYNIPAGLHDGGDLVDWLAAQPCCNGRIGTYGGSALGCYQLLGAADKPEALKAMFVEVPPVQWYHDNWFPGGIFETASRIGWLEGMTHNVGARVPVEDVEGDVDPEGDAVRRRVSFERLRQRDRRALDGRSATPQEWFSEMRMHTEWDDYWEQRNLIPVVRECDVPTVYTAVWYDHFVRGTCLAYEQHRGPKHLILTPGQQETHGDHADVNPREARLRWFDCHLKGIDNGVMDEPPVKAFVMGEERWRGLPGWPPSSEPRGLALSAGSSLTEPGAADSFEDTHAHDPEDPLPSIGSPLDIGDYEERALTYTSAPLPADLTVMGSPVARLRVRCTTDDAHLILKLADVFPDGRSRQITFGHLRAAHREGHDRVAPLTPGEAVDLTVPFWPTANTFKAGHRIRLVIAGSDSPRCEVYPEPTDITVLGDSSIELPVVE